MKKSLLVTASLSGLLVMSLCAPVLASATGDAKATGSVGFIEDEDGKTDPEVPDLPDGPGTKGALRIDRVSNIDFGANNKLSSSAQNYYALFEKQAVTNDEYPTSIQITDARAASTLGWKLTVKNDGEFTVKKPDGTVNTAIAPITNTQITLSDLAIKGTSNQEAANYPTINDGVDKLINISTGAAVDVLTATPSGDAPIGKGIWYVTAGSATGADATVTTGFGLDGSATTAEAGETEDTTKSGRNQAVKLAIPKGQIIEKEVVYTTDIVWTLSDAI